MSTGLHREASRGFDFDIENRSVAVSDSDHQSKILADSAQIQRMQSRLSEASDRRAIPQRTKFNQNPRASSGNNNPPFGMSRLRERAGSILSRKRAGTAGTNSSDPSMPRARVHRERDIDEGEQRDREEGFGSGIGTGSMMAPPEVPRV